MCWAIPIEMDLEGSEDLGFDGLWIGATLVIVLTPTPRLILATNQLLLLVGLHLLLVSIVLLLLLILSS